MSVSDENSTVYEIGLEGNVLGTSMREGGSDLSSCPRRSSRRMRSKESRSTIAGITVHEATMYIISDADGRLYRFGKPYPPAG